MTGNVMTNRQASQVLGAGRVYSVGCLPIIFVWFLLDLIGKTIIWGIASLCGKEVPGLATIVKWSASAILIPLGGIFIAIFIYWLYLIIADLVNEFRKSKKDKENDNERNGK